MNRKGKRRVAPVALALIAMAGAILLLLWNLQGDEVVVRAFKTELDGPGGIVLLRYSEPGSDELLLCCLGPMESDYYVRHKTEVFSSSPVFRYSLSRKTFEPAGLSEWAGATGNVIACDEQLIYLTRGWELDNVAHSVTFQRQKVTTAGGIAFRAAIAPPGDLLAVISADGEYLPSRGIFLGSPPGASGNRFHEVFRADTAERVGSAIRLAGASNDIVTSPCWAPDNRVVVYFGGNREKFWFVPIDDEIAPRVEKSDDR